MALRDASDSKIVRDGLNEQRILCRTGTHLMVQVRHTQLESKRLAEAPQCVQEDHRIWAAGNRDHERMAAANHLIVLDGLLHLVQEGIHGHSVQGDRGD